MRRWTGGLSVLLMALAFSAQALAQGGGASGTGTIQGKVTDAQGVALSGVTVTAISPSALGVQRAVTSDTGHYRLPAVPPGTYTVTYELAGFTTLKRDAIQVALAFTAHLNVTLTPVTGQETAPNGTSPLIDTSAARVQQNFRLEQLQSIPNGRDMWALLAVTPSAYMARIDVGGNRAGAPTDYMAYGFTGQVRALIEGINTTEGTGGAGFYFDYASLDEAVLGMSGQSAEMPNPGVQSQVIAQSGGNQFHGEYHLDWYNDALQGSNIPSAYSQAAAFNNHPIRPHSNEVSGYYDTDIGLGGPIAKDKLWWFFDYRDQKSQVAQPNFTFDTTFDTRLRNPVTKWTYQVNQKHRLIGYYQWGQKEQPNRMPFSTYTYTDPGQTDKQDSGSWVYKAEWNGTVSDMLYVEARFGDFGSYLPLIANSTDQYEWRDTGLAVVTGANQISQRDRDRKHWTGAATYFLGTGKGSHTFQLGGELLQEKGWEGYVQQWGGNIDHISSNGVSSQVVFALPTATDAGRRSAHDTLTSISALDQIGVFITDSWALGRATINAGVRYDRYHGFLPEQRQLGATTGPVSVAAKVFPLNDLYTWHQVAPRIGLTYDMKGNGQTVLKAHYGLFWHNPGVGVGGHANPNTAAKSATYAWNDLNGDQRWQPGEEGTLQSASLEGAISLDPALTDPYTHEAGAWLERQLTPTMGVRGGFVYKTEDDLIQTYQPGRGLSAYKTAGIPFTFVDVGPDGRRGTADDRNLSMVGLPSASASSFSATQVVMNVPQYGRYKTVEGSFNRRHSDKWSASIGGSWTLQTSFPNNYPQNPNQPGVADRKYWSFKATASYDAPKGVRVSPVMRYQSGLNYARTGTITVPTGVFVSGTTFYTEPMDANREDSAWVFDTRVEKTLTVGRMKLRGMIDIFNITNSHASETINRATGLTYLKPTAILAPFTMRLGFRLIF